MNKYFELENISKRRNALYGILSIFIMIFHSYLFWNIKILDYINSKLNVGVDIFLFLSAVSLFFSMEKNNNIGDFYIKRIQRVVFPGFIISVIWFYFVEFKSFDMFLKNIFFISFWTDGIKRQWFISFLLVMYLIYPIIYKIIKRNKNYLIILIVLDFIFNYWLELKFNMFFSKIEVALTRIPIFLIGCYFSQYIYDKNKVDKKLIRLLFIICAILIGLDYIYVFEIPYSRYMYIPISLYIITILTRVCNYIYDKNKFKYLIGIFEFLGNISLENYLIYEKLILYGFVVIRLNTIDIFIQWICISIIVSVFLSFTLKKICNLIYKVK